MELSFTDFMLNQVPVILIVMGVLTILTNLIVEVLKRFTYDKIPTNVLVVIVAVALSILALYVLMAWAALLVKWYHIAAAVVLAFLVAYAAMLGFDKLLKDLFGKIYELVAKVKELKT